MTQLCPVDTVLADLEAHADQLQQNWCVPREAGRFLFLLAKMIKAQSVCEVGTSIGYSTLWLAKALEETGGQLETIDYYASRQDQAKAHLEAAGLSHRVRFFQGDARETLKARVEANMTYDMVFLDAAKSQYIDYLTILEPIMAPGALLVADNTQSHRKEMLDFLAALEASPRFEVAEIETANGQILARVVEPKTP